jgi:hypothetical protein
MHSILHAHQPSQAADDSPVSTTAGIIVYPQVPLRNKPSHFSPVVPTAESFAHVKSHRSHRRCQLPCISPHSVRSSRHHAADATRAASTSSLTAMFRTWEHARYTIRYGCSDASYLRTQARKKGTLQTKARCEPHIQALGRSHPNPSSAAHPLASCT